MSEQPKCEVCGEPMPQGEEMFKFHGYSGQCPKPLLPKQPTALEMIAAEHVRHRVEGFTPEHDDEHDEGELACAAAAYAVAERLRNSTPPEEAPPVPGYWPWEREWWKPTPDDRIRELVKAGSLIVAEIERLQRLGANG